MKLFQALSAISLCLGMTQAWAGGGPDLSKEDLDVLSHQNLRKGSWVLSPVDAQARKNIIAARQHMEFEHPQLIEDNQTSQLLRYKVNPNSENKIEEIWLRGSKIEDLYVMFSAPSVARWHVPYMDNQTCMKRVQHPSSWAFSLGTPDLSGYYNLYKHKNGSYILKHQGTSSANFGNALEEHWWTTYISFNPSQGIIQNYTVKPEYDPDIPIPYIKGEVISEDTFGTLLKNKTITRVEEANPFLNQKK